jgi:ferredoxin
MIVTKQKPKDTILEMLRGFKKIFLIGCGECAKDCLTGGEEQVLEMKKFLEEEGKEITGFVIPEAVCYSSQVKIALAKSKEQLKLAEAILVLACGTAVQSVRENNRFKHIVFPGCDTLFGAIVDSEGNFKEVCSACSECLLDLTGGICPLTLCPKGILNGPCGGMDKGKCEVDKERDCAWVLIYKELRERGRLDLFKKVLPPKDFSKMTKPRKLLLIKGA